MRRGYRRCKEKARTNRELKDRQFDSVSDETIKVIIEAEALVRPHRGGNGTRPLLPNELDGLRTPLRRACA